MMTYYLWDIRSNSNIKRRAHMPHKMALRISLQLYDLFKRPIFAKSIPIIPLNLLIYNGMSGGPIINSKGNVIGMLSGSINVGGSLAWGIPSKAIISLITPLPSSRIELAKVVWRPMDSFSSGYRGFSTPKSLSVSETVEWLNEKWQERGTKEVDFDGFTAHVDHAQVTFNKEDKKLEFSALYTFIGDEYRMRIIVRLEDAVRAVAGSSYKLAQDAYYLVVECPKERSCVLFEKQKRSANGWRSLESKRMVRGRTGLWAMVDQDGAARAAMAIDHLIQLHGGPVERTEAFNPK